ncbi:MAG: hypothetical protein ACN6OS_19345 [Comamonas testosteroni]|uniref:hypothetical protein n=1 Tax=Comamonas testosteroni TaxID=285 RepID=UPI003D0F2BDF
MHESFNMGSPADFWLRYWRQRDLRGPGSKTRQSSQKAQRQQLSKKQSLLTTVDAAAANRLLSFETLQFMSAFPEASHSGQVY